MAQRDQIKEQEKVSAQCKVCNCASASVWMTALFDGVASSAQTQAAREHLKSCASCARVWREWNRTRALLRSIPSAIEPSSLPERVLLSCRMLPSQDAAAQSALDAEIAYEELARYINAPEAEYSADVELPPLAGFFEAAPVPDDLKNRILHSVSESERARKKMPVFRPKFSLPVWQSWSETARDWSLPRWGFALAVPAAAAFIFMAALPENASVPSTVNPTIAPSVAQQSPTIAATIFPKNLLPKIAQATPVLKASSSPKAVIAARPPIASSFVSPAEETLAAPQLINLSDSNRTPGLIPSVPLVLKTPVAALPDKPIFKVQIPKPPRQRINPMINMVSNSRPGVLRVSYPSRVQLPAQTLLRRLPDGGRQVSTLENVEERNDTPLFASRDFDETLESVGRLRDARPEELGDAVDVYRASILEQNTEDDFSDEDFDQL